MGYEDAPATRMLATHCIICGRPLVDATSVEVGMGPECRGYAPDSGPEHEKANKLVFEAALAAQAGRIEDVLAAADEIEKAGYAKLAEKVRRRFKKGAAKARRNPDIEIVVDGDTLLVKTPYRRKGSDEFVQAWRDIPGRRYDRNSNRNRIPVTEKAALWALLRKFFAGKYGIGPKGVFRVETPEAASEASEEASEAKSESKPAAPKKRSLHALLAERGHEHVGCTEFEIWVESEHDVWVWGFGTYPRWSVLAGQDMQKRIEGFDSLEEAKAVYPMLPVVDGKPMRVAASSDVAPDWFDPMAAGEEW